LKKKIKTLVCIIAQARASKLTWKYFHKNVLNHLNADLALCVSRDKNIKYQNLYYKNAKFIWEYPNLKEFSPAFDFAQKKIIGEKKNLPNWRLLKKIKDYWLGGIEGTLSKSSPGKKGSAAILIFFRWFLLYSLKKNNLIERYDRFIITRSDFLWITPHPTLKYLKEEFIWIPNGEFYGGVTDRHAILSQSNIHTYLNIIELIVTKPKLLFHKMKIHSKWNMEKYIKFNLKFFNYGKKIKFFPYLGFTVRDKKTDTTLSFGDYSPLLKLNIKYIREYILSIISKKIIRHTNDWNKIWLLNLKIKIIKFLFKFYFLRNYIFKFFFTNSEIDKDLINNYYKKKIKKF
jgi:hypothetical protein